MATRRSRLQIKPNIGPKVGTKSDNEKPKEKVKEKMPDPINSPTRTISSLIKSTDSEPKENKKPEKNLEEVKVGSDIEVEDATKSVTGQKPQYTALRAKIKAKPNLNLAGKPKRTTEEPLPKCPSSPLKSPRPNIPPVSLKSPVPRPSLPPCPSPVKHMPKPEMKIAKATEDLEEKTEKVKQVRRHTKVDISKDAPLDRTSMKMSDLIFWNPNRNFMPDQKKPEKSIQSVNKDIEPTVNPLLQASKEEIQVDEPEEEEEDEAMPVPQVKIGPDGNLIINEESLVVNTKKSVLEEETETIDETENMTTYASFRKPRTRQLWSNKETEKFYYALSSIGTDFTLMLKVFPNKTRTDLKKKFLKEDRENRWKIERALKERNPFDMDVFKRLDDLVEEEKREKEKIKKTKERKVESVKVISSSQSSTPIRRSKRKPTKKATGQYFDYSNEDFEEDEDDFVEAKPTSPKTPKWTSKKAEQEAKTLEDLMSGQFSALDQSEILQAIGDSENVNNGQGPIILVYNKPEDPAGETVIHVYRLQPQFSHLAANNGGQPIILDGNNLQLFGDDGQNSPSGVTMKDADLSNINGVSGLPAQFLVSDSDQILDISEHHESSEPQVFIPQNVMTLAQGSSHQVTLQSQQFPMSEPRSSVVNCVSESLSTQVEAELRNMDTTPVTELKNMDFNSVNLVFQENVNYQPASETTETVEWGTKVENSTEQRVCVEQVSTIIDVNIVKDDT